MGRAVRQFDCFWFADGSAISLAILRIVIGGYALLNVTDRFDGFLRNARISPSLFEPVGPVAILSEPLPIEIFQAILMATVVLGALFILGIGYRFSGPLFGIALLWVLSYQNSWTKIFHTDNLLVLQVIIVGFTRAADALSLGSVPLRDIVVKRRIVFPRGWLFGPPYNHWEYGYAIRLLCLVTTLTYFVSGVAKVTSPLGLAWGTGESLRSQIAYDVWRKQLLAADPPTLLFSVYDQLWLFTALGVGTLIVELGAPLAALSGWIALVWVPSAFLMHQGIAMLMGISFPYQMSGVAFAPFVPWARLVAGAYQFGRSILHPTDPQPVPRAAPDSGVMPGLTTNMP
jgi:hypothetical protein